MKVTAFSMRYYPEEMDKAQPGSWNQAVSAIASLNELKIRMYDAYYQHTYHKGSPRDILAQKGMSLYEYGRSLGYNSLYINSMEPFAKGILKSQVSNQDNYKAGLEDEIESINEKLDSVGKDLNKKQSVKDAIVVYAKTGVWKKPYPKCSIKIDKIGLLSGYKIPPVDYRIYERKVEADIRRLKSKKGILGQAIRRREKKLEDMKAFPPKRAVFGSRALYRQKDTVGNTDEWKAAFQEARHKSITISGRADSIRGNYIVLYGGGVLVWKLPNGDTIHFLNFKLGSCMEEFEACLKNNNESHTSIGYTFELRRDGQGRQFLLVKASFTPVRDTRINDSFADGCVSVDINVDRLAVSELDKAGKQINHFVIPMDLEGLTTGQAADAIGRAVRKLTGYCVKKHKPLVIENLQPAAMKKKMRYSNKTRNRKISQFACERIRQTIYSQAERVGSAVIEVNPKYTSFIGKVLYMRPAGQSVHEAASCVIGMRGMGILPETPPALAKLLPGKYPGWAAGDPEKEYYYRWKALYQKLKEVPAHLFYRELPEFKDKKSVTRWVKECTA